MSDQFLTWFFLKMVESGYVQYFLILKQDVSRTAFKNNHQSFIVIYIKKPIEISDMKNWFTGHNTPILLVVDSDLVTEKTVHYEWLRAIHALYYGRIYAWDGKGILPVHYDSVLGELSTADYLEPNAISFEQVDCWYKGFPGVFNIARFNDPVFWKKTEKPPKDTAQQEYEDFWKQEFNRQESESAKKHKRRKQQQSQEDVFRDFQEAYERNKRVYEEMHNHPPPPSRYKPQGDQWFMAIMAGGNLEAGKKIYRQLAMENHPDRKGDSSEVIQTMQLINAAWERAKEYLS